MRQRMLWLCPQVRYACCHNHRILHTLVGNGEPLGPVLRLAEPPTRSHGSREGRLGTQTFQWPSKKKVQWQWSGKRSSVQEMSLTPQAVMGSGWRKWCPRSVSGSSENRTETFYKDDTDRPKWKMKNKGRKKWYEVQVHLNLCCRCFAKNYV